MAKRRANGEGNIRKRSDGRWEGRYTVGHDPVTGKQIFKNVLGKTQAEVREKLSAAIAEAQKIDVVVSDKMCVCDWMDTWLENFEKPNMRASTYESYEGNIRLHVNPGIGYLKLNKITTLDLQKFFNRLLTDGRIVRKESREQPKGLSVKTVSNIRTMLYSAFDKAVAEHLMVSNPVVGCKLPKREKQEMKTMQIEDLGRFFAEAKASGKFEFYYVELSTGMRRGELLGLKWEDVNYEKKTLTIRRQVIRVQGHIEEGPLKTKNAYRTVAIGDDLVDLLRDLHEREGNGSPYIFPSPNGGPQDPDSVLPMFKRILKRAGLPEMRFHDCRHTFSLVALANGVDFKTLSAMLGHYSVAFTLDVYGHVNDDMKRDAADKVSGVLKSAL